MRSQSRAVRKKSLKKSDIWATIDQNAQAVAIAHELIQPGESFKLTDDQAAAVETINAGLEDGIFEFLLKAPTGSGKTEVYLRAVQDALAAGGGVRQLGISNVDLGQLRLLVADASVKPAFVQNRCFARTKWDREVRAFCSKHAIRYQGFSLLTANRSIFERPRFTEIVRRSRLTPAQVVFAFSLGAGMLPLTGTTDPAHMSEDLLALDRRLSAEDQRAMENITEA